MGMHEGSFYWNQWFAVQLEFGMFQIRNLDEWRMVIKFLLFYLLIYFYKFVEVGTMLYVLHFYHSYCGE